MHKAWNRMKSVLYRDSAVAVLLKTGEIHHFFFVQTELGVSGWLSSAFSRSKVLVLFFFSVFLSLFFSAFLVIFIYGFPETFLYFTATGGSSKLSRPQSFYQDDDLL